jgi:hypothetical protein
MRLPNSCDFGRTLDDPRSTGQGLNLLAWMSLVSDAYAEALQYSEQCLAVAIAPYERNGATGAKGSALVLLRRTDEGAPLLEEHHRRCAADGNFYTLAHSEGVIGICKVLQGSISEGVALLEAAIVRQEGAGFQRAADLYRLQLSEIFVRIVSGVEMLPLMVLLRNLPVLLKAMAIAPSRVRGLDGLCASESAFRFVGTSRWPCKLANWLALQSQEKTCARTSAPCRGKTDTFAIRANPDSRAR